MALLGREPYHIFYTLWHIIYWNWQELVRRTKESRVFVEIQRSVLQIRETMLLKHWIKGGNVIFSNSITSL
jgi:hypothetical protein